MSDQIIELAIRAPKPKATDAVFFDKMRHVVDALLRVDGVGPERAFTAFETQPASDRTVAIGMTRYADKRAQRRATRNLGVLRRLLGFVRVMNPSVGVFMRPHDPTFDLASFASRPGAIVGFAALVPTGGTGEEAFLAARSRYLEMLGARDEVLGTNTFDTIGGLKAKDAIVHFVEYRDRGAYDALRSTLASNAEFKALDAVATVTMIAVGEATGAARDA